MRPSCRPVLLLLCAWCLIPAPAQAGRAEEPDTAPPAFQALPDAQRFRGLGETRRRGLDQFDYQVLRDRRAGTVAIVHRSADADARMVYGEPFVLLTADATLKDPDLIRRRKADRTETRFNAEARTHTLSRYRDGRLTETRTNRYEGETDGSVIPLALQARLLMGRTGIWETPVHVRFLNLRIRVRFTPLGRFGSITDVPDGNLPETLVRHAPSLGPVFVYRIAAAGMLGAVPGQRHYLAFQAKIPHAMVASWGAGDEGWSAYWPAPAD